MKDSHRRMIVFQENQHDRSTKNHEAKGGEREKERKRLPTKSRLHGIPNLVRFTATMKKAAALVHISYVVIKKF